MRGVIRVLSVIALALGLSATVVPVNAAVAATTSKCNSQYYADVCVELQSGHVRGTLV